MVLCIPQNSSITGISPSDCLVSYPRHSLGWILPLCRGAVCVFCVFLGKKLISNVKLNNLRWLAVRETIVAYWPPTRLSCQKKKCTYVNNRYIRSNISGATLIVEVLNWVRTVTLARSRWTTNYYITPATGSPDRLERRCWNEQPRRTGKKGCDSQKSWGVSMLQSLFGLQLPLTHNLFNKVRGIFF